MNRRFVFGCSVVVWSVVPLLAGCGGAGDSLSDEPTGEAVLELSTVPAGAQCLQVIGSAGLSFNVTAPLTAGASSSSVVLGRLPLGTGTISANVFDAACTALSGQTATWVADQQQVTLRVGVIANITLNLRPNNAVGVNANFIGNVTDIVAGVWTTGLVMADNTVRFAGQWPGVAQSLAFVTPATGFTNVAELAPPRDFASHACLRTTAGAIQCFGRNVAGALGPSVPIGGVQTTPTTIPGTPPNVAKLVNGMFHSCLLTREGFLRCWGANSFGQLGNGTTTNSSTPVQATFVVQVMLAVGYNHTCSYNTALNCWGLNSNGQLGDGTTTNRSSPTQIFGVSGAISVAAGGSHTCYVRADGTAYCWGSNSDGQLGDGTTTQRLTPTQVPGITDAVEVVAGEAHTCLRRSGGTVTCFGRNGQGQIGDGTGSNFRASPTAVAGVSNVAKLVGSGIHNCALHDNRQVTCWGSNQVGESANGTLGDLYKATPAIVQ